MTHAPLTVNVLGFGTVGQALARLLLERPSGAHGRELRVVGITDRGGTVAEPAGVDLHAALAAKARDGFVTIERRGHTLANVARRLEADVVVDLLPTDLRTGEQSLSVTRAALNAGRHVVTAGKGVLALHAADVRDWARGAHRRVLGSAAVLGGTPALELLTGAFRGDRLTGFQGVLNGSTNLLLSLLEEGASWADAMHEARRAGVLEADPTLDVQGLDAAAKAVILANHAWGKAWSLDQARVRGIESVSPREARDARADGRAVRLVATATPTESVSVAPASLPRDHPLVTTGTENALRLELAGAGAVTLRGPGAGGRETASAVLSDLVALALEDPARTPHARGIGSAPVAP